MTPGRRDFTIYAGSTFAESIIWKVGTPPAPVDLTGATARMHIRRKVSAVLPLLQLTTENGRIQIPVPAEGQITLSLSPTETAAIEWDRGEYQLEVELADGTVRRLIEGRVTVSPEITR